MLSNDSYSISREKSLFGCAPSFTQPSMGIVIGYGYSQKAILFINLVEVRIKGMTYRYRPGAGKEVTIRKRLIKKKGKKCEVCSYSGYIEMHHIKRVVDGGEHSEENCVLLCEKCHARTHGYKKKKYLDSEREHWIGEAL